MLDIVRYLEAALADRTFQQGGRILALIDTDERIVQHTPRPTKNLTFRRLLLTDDDVLQLVNVDSNRVSPSTEIEDCLNASVFRSTLAQFNASEHGIDIERAVNSAGRHSRHSLDLKQSERAALTAFFETKGRKTAFARRYVEQSAADSLSPSNEGLAQLILEALQLTQPRAQS